MKKHIIAIVSMIAASLPLCGQVITDEHVRKAEALVARMTFEEKCQMIVGQTDGMHTYEIPRLGIRSIRFSDGPQGIRTRLESTYYPAGVSLASTWDRDLAHCEGEWIAADATARGVRLLLAPGVNMYRVPVNGRNFEYFGEDPYLASETALNYVNGVQSRGVISTLKHFALNNQEYLRHGASSCVDERTMNEIYFPVFRKAVEQGHAGAVMTAYNPINGSYCAENEWLIKDNLRAWGHRGIVMSDWNGTYSCLNCVKSGLDLEMPCLHTFTDGQISELLDNGVISIGEIDEKCVHILSTLIAFDLFEKDHFDRSVPEYSEDSRLCSHRAALEGPVMLKNDGLLPLKASRKGEIAILGPSADHIPMGKGAGRGAIMKGRGVTYYQGMQKLGKGYDVVLYDWKNLSESDLQKIAASRAVVLTMGYDMDSEGEDLDKTYGLPAGQDSLIRTIAARNANTVVVINSGSETDVRPWFDEVAAVIFAWFPGEEGGAAMAELLSGQVSPSGRLPFTFWGSPEANPTMKTYPLHTPPVMKNGADHLHLNPFVMYREGIFLGYRGVEKFGVEPMFPFGFGLTYSQFEYSDLQVHAAGDCVKVAFKVKNTGKAAAAAVPQVYVQPQNPSVMRPDRELKGYDRIMLAPGQSSDVEILLGPDAFSYYSTALHSWKLDRCTYRILVGSSSRDIVLTSDEIKL